MKTSYGIDYSVYPNVDTTFQPMFGEEVLLQAVYKRITTRTGDLFWDPTGTCDVRDWLLDTFSKADIAAKESYLTSLFEADPRMNITFSLFFEQGKLNIDAVIHPSVGNSFRASFQVDSYSITIQKL